MKNSLLMSLAVSFLVFQFAMPVLAAEGDITIFVNPGNSVSDATVSVTVNGKVMTAVSNYMGIAVFNKLPTGTYTFTASKSGYGQGSGSFTVNAGSGNTGSIFLSAQTGNAEITVNDKNTGKAISGVQVTVSIAGVSQYVNTDSKGVAAFANLKTGAHSFATLKTGYKDSSTNVTITQNGNTKTTVRLEPVVASKGAFGDIAVFVNPGNAVSGADVSVAAKGDTKKTKSDAQGIARFYQVPTGKYTFKANMEGFKEGTAELQINDGPSNTGSIVMVPRVGDVKITVQDKYTKKPISGVQVTVSIRGVSQYQNTNGSGIVSFPKIQVGTHAFKTLKSGYFESVTNVTVQENKLVAQTIFISQPIPAKLHFELSSSAKSDLTYKSGCLRAEKSSWNKSVQKVSSDQTVEVPEPGEYRFHARWDDKRTRFPRYTKSDIINITKPGTYNLNPTASPDDPQ